MDIKVKEESLRKAMELHVSQPVVDAHLDLAGEVLMRRRAGERNVVKTRYLPHFQSAGIRLVVSSVYVETENLEHGWENALEQIQALKEDISESEGIVLLTKSREMAALFQSREPVTGILLYMEGLDCIGEDVERLSDLHRLGVRGASLTWSRPNALANGCCRPVEHRQIPGGLTQTGIRALKKLEELSMFLDVSHLNDEGFDQVCRLAGRPFVATHSGSRSVYDNYRNLTDEQLGRLAGQGGVAGMNGCKYIAGSLEGNHLEMLCRHIEHEAALVGAEHVGYGFDLCDSYNQARAALQGKQETERDDCLLHHGQVPLVAAALLQRGMSKKEVCRIMGGSFADYFIRFDF